MPNDYETRKGRLLAPSASVPTLGLMHRRKWTDDLLRDHAASRLAWLEIFPENYMHRGRRIQDELRSLSTHYPVITHGVHLNLGGTDPLDERYLEQLSTLTSSLGAPWFSDHLGASILDGQLLHEVVPVAFNESEVTRLAARADLAATRVGRPFAFENAATYMRFPESSMTETEFVVSLLAASEAHLLLDVNNLWVNANNFGYDPYAFLRAIPADRVIEIHVGGFTVDAVSGLLIDTHGAAPTRSVLRLLREALARVGPRPVLFEWEMNAPSFSGLEPQLDALALAWREAFA